MKHILVAPGLYDPMSYEHLRMFHIAKQLPNVVGCVASITEKNLKYDNEKLAKDATKDLNWIEVFSWQTKLNYKQTTEDILTYYEQMFNTMSYRPSLEGRFYFNCDDLTNVSVKLLCGSDYFQYIIESEGRHEVKRLLKRGVAIMSKFGIDIESIIRDLYLDKYLDNVIILKDPVFEYIGQDFVRNEEKNMYLLPYLPKHYNYK